MRTNASVRSVSPAEHCRGCGAAVIRNPEQPRLCQACLPYYNAAAISRALTTQLRVQGVARGIAQSLAGDMGGRR